MSRCCVHFAIKCELCLMLRGVIDDLKVVLSMPDVFKTLLTVMERYEKNAGDDQMTLMSSMADLIVLLLTGGENSINQLNQLEWFNCLLPLQ